MDNDIEEDKCAVSKEEMREFLLPLVEKYFEEESDLAAFETMRDEPRRTRCIDDVSGFSFIPEPLKMLLEILTVGCDNVIIEQ